MTQLFEEFQAFRRILCICPCCGDLVRVSDLKLKGKGAIAKTWLDKHQKKEQDMAKKAEKFGEREERLREIAREKGRKEAEKVFNNAILPSFKALKLDPFDVKPILNPIDFVVFDGMNKKENIKDVIFLSKMCKSHSLNSIRLQIKKVIADKKYDWQVARIDEAGGIIFE